MRTRSLRPTLYPTLLIALAVAALCWSAVAAFPLRQAPLTDGAAVNATLTSAEAAWARGDTNLARPDFERALEAAHRLGLTREEAAAECGLGEVLFAQGHYAEAREHGLKALALFDRLPLPLGVGRATELLAHTAELMGDYAEARLRGQQAVDIFDRAGDRRWRARASLTLQRVLGSDTDQRARLLARAIDDARAVGDRSLEGQALHSWGDQLFSLGRYEQALEKLEQAAAAFESIHNDDSLGTVFNSLGRVYRAHGRPDEALKWQLKALELHERGNVPVTLMQSQNAVAVVYQLIGDLPKARAYYDRALKLAERFGSPRIRDFLRANIANLQLEQGEFAAGAKTLEEVIANQRDVYVSERNKQLAFAYLKLGRTREALEAANRAVDSCGDSKSRCIDALDRRADVYAALHDYPAALADVRKAIETIETVRANLVPADFFKQEFHRRTEEVYSAAIALQFEQREERKALETAELARSRAFLDLLASRDAGIKESSDSDRSQLQQDPSASDAWKASTDAAPSEPPFRGNPAPQPTRPLVPPADLSSAVNAPPADVDDLVAVASRLKSTLAIYWAGQDELYIWIVRGDGTITARRVPVLRSRLLALVTSTASVTPASTTASEKGIQARGAGEPPPASDRERAWRALYDLLIAPVRTLLPRTPGSLLTIVPHGPLLNLSFAALQDSHGRYLLEDYTLHYVPAGALLQFTESKRRPDARAGRILLVADPALPPLSPLEPRLPRLPGARQEARSIAQLVPRSRVVELESDAASESRVRTDSAGKAILHFATHAIVHDEDPARSYLVLGRDGSESTSDGILTAQEIYRLNLNADLIVLSACRSAGGRITGDGLATFARAFMYAGTPSLIASLWDVADEPVNRLMPAFYRSWFAGASKARSLRAAQLRFLSELRTGTVRVPSRAGVVVLSEDPMFWAGFLLIGEPD